MDDNTTSHDLNEITNAIFWEDTILEELSTILDFATSEDIAISNLEPVNNEDIPNGEKDKYSGSKTTGRAKKNKQIQLPPCFVCGAVSSGIHFGAITCESCKVFFRRSLIRKAEYFCSRDENCVIGLENRSDCQYCRLKKCYEVGMSKNSAKKGRYTREQKKDLHKMVAPNEMDKRTRQNEMHQKLIKETIQRLKKLHKEHQIVTPEVVARLREIQKGALENRKAAQEALGQMPAEVRDFFQSTGLDIPGYISKMKPCARTCSGKWAMAFINYVTDLEEFMRLSLSDRIITLKGSSTIWTLCTAHKAVCMEGILHSCIHCGACYTVDELRISEKCKHHVTIISPFLTLKHLNLTDDEIAMLQAFVIFDTSQNIDAVEEPMKVGVAQDLFMECLLHVLEQNRGKENASKVYAKIIHVITEARSYMSVRSWQHRQMLEIAQEVRYPRIAVEVFNIPEHFVDELEEDLNNLQLV